MSLLRQRASEASVESTRSDRSPAEARAWLVNVSSWRSDVALNVLELQAKTPRGATSSPTVVTAKATAVIAAQRRGSRRVVNEGLGRRARGAEANISAGRSWGAGWKP